MKESFSNVKQKTSSGRTFKKPVQVVRRELGDCRVASTPQGDWRLSTTLAGFFKVLL
jgi:hypothetical protein